MSVVRHATVHSTPALVAKFQTKVPEAILKNFSSTRVNYVGE